VRQKKNIISINWSSFLNLKVSRNFHEDWNFGIPFEDITTLSPNLDPSKSVIILVTNETTATRIRELLEISETEESK